MEKTDEQNAEITENLDENSNLLPTKSFTEEKEINGEKVTFYRTDAILDGTEEDKLLHFLNKVQKAYNQDDSLPDFLGDTLKTWIGEIEQKKEGDSAHGGADNNSQEQSS